MSVALLEPKAPLEGRREPATQPEDRDDDKDWLERVHSAYEESDTFLDTAIRNQWERNIANFQSRHPDGSKYYTAPYKYRAKNFRPKSRSMARNNEANAAAAFFSTQDIVNISAENDSDPRQNLSAKLINELCNYRLKQQPWFLTCMGAYQDATAKYGVCVSYQSWEYEENPDGEIVKDAPSIELRPPENIRISPAASWIDPINSSPYVIDIMPTYLDDVKEMVKASGGPNGIIQWRELSDQELTQAREDEQDSTRRANQGPRPDPKTNYYTQDQNNELVWMYRTLIRKDGEDWLIYTVGHSALLADPIKAKEFYPHLARLNVRPYVMGWAMLDTHKTHPPAMTEITQGLQSLANDIANQRVDNVRLAMNKRYAVKRGVDMNYTALTQSVPGGVVPLNNPQNDIKELDVPEVTGSAYQEQDRINVDFDELAGEFSTSSVQSNRSLNETVGGMQLMQAGSSQVKEYQIKLFSESWVLHVMRQLAYLELWYETDETVIGIAGRKLGLDEVSESLFLESGMLNINVNVGMGATNPQQRIERLMLGLNSIATLLPDAHMDMNKQEVINEVFGSLGYQDGERFYNFGQPRQPDPAVEAEAQAAQNEAALKQQELAQKGLLAKEEMDQSYALALLKLQLEKTAKEADLELEMQRMEQDERRAQQQAQEAKRDE